MYEDSNLFPQVYSLGRKTKETRFMKGALRHRGYLNLLSVLQLCILQVIANRH